MDGDLFYIADKWLFAATVVMLFVSAALCSAKRLGK